MGEAKLSLLARYDDLCRYSSVFQEGCEIQIKPILESQKFLIIEMTRLKEVNHSLGIELEKTSANLKVQSTKNYHLKSLLDKEIEKRRQADLQKEQFRAQINLICEVLMTENTSINDKMREKLAFLYNTSFGRLETIEEADASKSLELSYDKTEEDILDDDKSEEDVQGDLNDEPHLKDKSYSLHETTLDEPPEPISPIQVVSQHENAMCQASHDSFSPGSFFSPSFANNSTMNTSRRFSLVGKQQHKFCVKLSIKLENCIPCGNRIKFYHTALKCYDCRMICHQECKDKAALPCVPVNKGKLSKKAPLGIAEYVSTTSPMMPSFLVSIINEIELRGLSEVGLYRVPANQREVREKRESLVKGKRLNFIKTIDVHVLCGIVKDFLRILSDPLITSKLWNEFAEAAVVKESKECNEALCKIIEKLPQPNRDTLALLILHLQKIVQSPSCKMNESNIAKMIGPIIVGFTTKDTNPIVMLEETHMQHVILEKILRIPSEYWAKFVLVEEIVAPPKPKRFFSVTGLQKNTPPSRTNRRSYPKRFFSKLND